MWRLLFVGALAGCAGVSGQESSGSLHSGRSVNLLRCAGTLPGSPISYVYRAEVVEGETEQASVDVFMAGARGSGSGEFAEVSAELDWKGEPNGGSFLFYPAGAALVVEYSDPDGSVAWSMPACFDVP